MKSESKLSILASPIGIDLIKSVNNTSKLGYLITAVPAGSLMLWCP